MHQALRSFLVPAATLALAAVISLSGCATHDRRIYTTHQDKNLHTPNAWSPSTAKAADDATSSLGVPPDSGTPSAPSAPEAPVAPAPPVSQ